MPSGLWHPKSRRLHVVLLLSLSYFCSSLIVANFGLNLTCMVVDHPINASSPKCHQSPPTSKRHVYKGTLNWSRHQEDLLLSATSWGSLVAQLPSMWIARRLPAKLVLLLVMIAHVLFNGLIPVFAVYLGYSSVFVLRVLIGVSHWFPRFERSTALAVFAVGGQLAGIVGGPLTGAVCGSSIGWQFNFYLTSGIGCVFCVMWQLFSAESPRSARGVSKAEQRFLLQNVHVQEKPTGSVPYAKIVFSIAVLAEFQMNFGTCVAQTITQSFFPQFFKEQVMISPVMNGYFTAIPNLCSFIVRLAWSTGVDLLKKRDHLGPTASTKLSQAISSLGISLLFLVMAFFVGCNDPGVALAVASLIAVCQSLESAEIVSAMSMFFSQSARLATPYAVNALRNYEKHGWQYVFFMASFVSFISGTIFVLFGSGVEQEWAKSDSTEERKEEVIEETTRI